MFVRAYLRASTKQQDANRAKTDLLSFAKERGLKIAASYVENESGASLQRPELFRLLSDSEPGDILLIEQVDRLSRLNAEDWEKLKNEIKSRQVRVVALDLPTSWSLMSSNADEFTMRMSEAINSMMLDRSPLLLVRIMRTADVVKCKGSQKRRMPVSIRAVLRTMQETLPS